MSNIFHSIVSYCFFYGVKIVWKVNSNSTTCGQFCIFIHSLKFLNCVKNYKKFYNIDHYLSYMWSSAIASLRFVFINFQNQNET